MDHATPLLQLSPTLAHKLLGLCGDRWLEHGTPCPLIDLP